MPPLTSRTIAIIENTELGTDVGVPVVMPGRCVETRFAWNKA